MGILDFFRKVKKEKAQEIENIEEFDIDKTDYWIESKTNEIQRKEKEVFDLINKRIDIFVRDINEKIKIVEELDIESKKVDNPLKVIVKQSLKGYIDFVNIFIKDLNEVKKQSLIQFIVDTNKIFSYFGKHSHIFYKKATLLIGNELAAVKQETNNLSDYLALLFKKNQRIMNFYNKTDLLKLKLKQFREINVTLSNINSEIISLGKKITNIKGDEQKILYKIEKVKLDKSYTENLKKKAEIELIEKQLENDFSNLRSNINFKILNNIFHSDEKKMALIKGYIEDFRGNLEKNKNELLSLINEAKLDIKTIEDKISQIEGKKQRLTENKKLLKEDEIKILNNEIQKIRLETENLKIDEIKQLKRKEVVIKNQQEIKELINQYIKELESFLED